MESTLVRLKMNIKEQTDIIIRNFVKMLFRRKLIKDLDKTINNIKNNKNNEIYTWKNEDQTFFLIIHFHKLNGIKKGSTIEDNLIKTNATNKFIICKESSAKTYTQIKDFNTELFTIFEFLSDIPSNPLIPTHILLNEKEKEEVLQVYQEKNIAKILLDDMMVRYIGAKKGDIIRIIRSSLNTGESIYYRRVV